MKLQRIIGSVTAVVALTAAGVLYAVHPAKSSDHQDTFNLATRANTSADITDVYVFPAPDNANNVVFAMDVSPLIMPGQGTSKFFDPTLMYQFKISHTTSGKEDQVIQLGVNGTGASQKITLYGPGAPNEVGTTNTFLKTPAGTTPYNTSTTTLQNGTIKVFGGPRTDPFFFDLFAFFTFLGDRNYGTHTSQVDPGPETAANPEGLCNGNSAANINSLTPAYDKTPTMPCPTAPTSASFNGFAAGTMSNTPAGGRTTASAPALGVYACSTLPTFPASDTLFAGPFNVLSLVVEVPKSLISGAPFNTSAIHVWATVNSSTGS
jgi:hypothetical protein